MTMGVVVVVTDHENGYFHHWPVKKFEDRLFLIKDILEDFQNEGKKPNFTFDKDPFVDHPTPILIGTCNLKLHSLLKL
jgi:hypothetical protein